MGGICVMHPTNSSHVFSLWVGEMHKYAIVLDTAQRFTIIYPFQIYW